MKAWIYGFKDTQMQIMSGNRKSISPYTFLLGGGAIF